MIDYKETDDLTLQKLAYNGDRTAEEELSDRYMYLVDKCAGSLFIKGGERNDLLQEGTIGLLSAIRQYNVEYGVPFLAFAKHCIKMQLFSAIKTASRFKHFPLNDALSLEKLSVDSSEQNDDDFPEVFRIDPEDLVLAKERKEELYAVVSKSLSKFEIQVLMLYLSGLSYRDIAARLDKEVKSIDNAVQRIRRKLAQDPNLGEISKS